MTVRLQPARLTVTRELIREYASVSDDFNPIHLDPDYAAGTPMRGIIAHGTISLNLIWHSIEQTFGRDEFSCVMTEVRFKAPVRENDTLEAGGETLEDSRIAVWVQNQDKLKVIEGVAAYRKRED